MPVHVVEGEDRHFCPSLELGLGRSGIAITSDSAQATVTITCWVEDTGDTGWLRIEENGEVRSRFIVRVNVISAQQQPVDQFVVEYKGFRSRPDEEAVSKVVLAYAYSPRIAAFARAAKTAAPVATTTETQPVGTATTATPQRDARDDALWFGIDTVKCKIPARVEACDPVRRYLQRFPNGAHTQEANDVLTAAQPALEKLQKDDVAWQKSMHSECLSRRTSDACAGVEAYDMQFPTGLHSDEAKRLLRAAAGH